MKKHFLILCGCFVIFCQSSSDNKKNVPVTEWAKGAVWYQIFPERFRNGDPGNDPIKSDVPKALPDADWQISPWTDDWYKFQPWEQALGLGFYKEPFFLARRYGGDLIGVLEKLDYLNDLGIDAIYFNPIFEAQSHHKYDGASYHHIDDNFGPDPIGDRRRLVAANETENPLTWIWTSADSTFLRLVQEAHKRDIRIVIDGVFNHTGRAFFAFQDILKNGQSSRYADWYDIASWDNPATPANEFDYKGWWGYKDLPEFAENENGLKEGPKDYIFAATKRWMDPNGDGDPSDGIDGWRLDVVLDVAPPFWRDWYTHVKSINPNAITVAEIWDDASEWIEAKRMDNTMNYLFAKAVVDFFIDKKTAITGQTFMKQMDDLYNRYGEVTSHLLWNLIDSHDTDRLASMIINPDRDYDQKNKLNPDDSQFNPDYNIRKPNENERQIQKQIVAFQMVYIGAPVIYYGDEAGMWGADDPDDRKPMLWEDLEFEIERSHPLPGKKRPADPVFFDRDMVDYYKRMIKLRQDYPVYKTGDLHFFQDIKDPDLIAFCRTFNDQQSVLFFNRSDEPKRFSYSSHLFVHSRYKDVFTDEVFDVQNNKIDISVQNRWYRILHAF